MSKIKSMRIDDISYDIGADYSNIDNAPTFKTINGQTITGTGNITEIFIGDEAPSDTSIRFWLDTSDDDTPTVTYTITNNLTNCTNSNASTVVNSGSTYIGTIIANGGYELDTVTCTMGGESQAVNNGVINIPFVTGNIIITATAQASQVTTYNVTNTLTNVSNSNTASVVNENSLYTGTLTANSGYEISEVVITMGGTNITSTAYLNGSINISSVTGDITITATATKVPETYTITNNLTRSSNSNSATTITEGQPYTATITPDTHYALGDVTCTMDGVSQTVTGGVINIASVTGNIVITAKGVINTDYQEVEYIQSSGGQIIDFNFKPNQDLIFETQIQDLTTGSSIYGLFGGYGTSPNRGIVRFSYKGFEYMYGDNGADAWVSSSKLRTEPTKLKIDGNKMYINDTLVKTYTANTFESEVNAGMFAQKASTGNSRFAYVKCWGAKIKQGNVDIELVPCYRKSDDVIGMYDVINDEFYVSSGTAFSIKGGDV